MNVLERGDIVRITRAHPRDCFDELGTVESTIVLDETSIAVKDGRAVPGDIYFGYRTVDSTNGVGGYAHITQNARPAHYPTMVTVVARATDDPADRARALVQARQDGAR